MSQASDICELSAVEMARLIRERQLSARDTVEAHLAQIERENPGVNAIITMDADGARQRAREADEAQARGAETGPLHGLPTVHKDLQSTKGMRTTFGSRIFKDFVPDEDSLLVERVRSAGAISVGKTNTPEFGAGSQTYNEVFGATLNPFDKTKTCGGSSGGAAAALACHMVPVADGSDLGGSLRNPASFCNVVGFRPSIGRVPVRPVPGALPMFVEGPMARSVDDMAFFYSVLSGDHGSLGRDFKGVRIAWWKDLGEAPVDSGVKEMTNAQRRVFESLGCIVEEAEPDFRLADETFRTLRAHSAFVRFGELAKQNSNLIKEEIRGEIEHGSRLSARDVTAAEENCAVLARRMDDFLKRYEFFVLPVSQVLPFAVTEHWPREINGVKMTTYIDWMKSCYFISVMATPAISVPCGFTREGLPVGIQITGRAQHDWSVLQIANAFEKAH